MLPCKNGKIGHQHYWTLSLECPYNQQNPWRNFTQGDIEFSFSSVLFILREGVVKKKKSCFFVFFKKKKI